MNKTFLYVAIILVVLMAVNAYLAPVVVKELFVNDEESPIKAINRWNGNVANPQNMLGVCGRNIVFPYFKNNRILASHRALADNGVNSIPIGTCRMQNTENNINDSYSIVYENGLFYSLRKACIKLYVSDISIPEPNHLVIRFPFEKGEEINNLVLLHLLNPLWIEFVPNQKRITLAYVLKNTEPVSTVSPKRAHTAHFYPLLSYNEGSIDDLFNYRQLSASQSEFDYNDAQECNRQGYVSMYVYYLDDIPSSFQTTGRYMEPVYDNSGTCVIFDPNFDKTIDKIKQKQTYEFMNNINLMYKNYTVPVFTFEFDIIVKPGMQQAIAQCYMNNSVGKYTSCDDPVNNIGDKINNIFMMMMLDSPNGVTLTCFTGYSFGWCGSNQTGMVSEGSPLGRLDIPILSEGTRVNIMVTITPYNRVLYAEWKDTNKKDAIKKCAYVNNQSCAKNATDNALFKLFSDKSEANRKPLKEILFKYHTDIVKGVNKVSLGYKNFYKTKFVI